MQLGSLGHCVWFEDLLQSDISMTLGEIRVQDLELAVICEEMGV